MHYNGSKSFLFGNGVKIYQFESKDSEINAHPMCLGNISRHFSVHNKNKIRLFEYMYDYDNTDDGNNLDIYKQLKEKDNI